MLYLLLKFVHVLGVVLLIGNVTITAVWKIFADKTRNVFTVKFAQKLVIEADWAFTVPGIVLIAFGGYGMAYVANIGLTTTPWLLWGQICFVLSGMMWLCILVPLQTVQYRLSKKFGEGEIPARYWRLGYLWLVWGVLATLPLLVAMYLMVTKT